MSAAAPALVPSATADPFAALNQRLASAAEALGLQVRRDDDPVVDTSRLFSALVEHVHGETRTEALWLLLATLGAALPTSDEVLSARRARELRDCDDFGTWLLDATFVTAAGRGAMDLEMDVVRESVVVDVDFTARNTLHTGIQRVVRETVPRWCRDHAGITLVAWTDPDGAMRRLTEREHDRVLRWGAEEPAEEEPTEDVGTPGRHRLVVPLRCTVVLPEIPSPEHCSGLAALALYSGNRVGLVGHDCIPVISPDIIHAELPDRFARFLETVKAAHIVVGVSASAAREFRGFAEMLPAQGLEGPTVVHCMLPVEAPPGEAPPKQDPPLVVSVGSFEPRKNQLAVLTAAETLWREGLRFELLFLGGGGWVTEADAVMRRLTSLGRPIRRRTAVSDDEMWQALRRARFSVFVSLHEGYGLPVAESLACGTPCLTTSYGSTREIADGGGALVVDPTDDDAIAGQMRRLLSEDDLIARLRTEAEERPRRTWDDYARELWDILVAPAVPDTGDAR